MKTGIISSIRERMSLYRAIRNDRTYATRRFVDAFNNDSDQSRSLIMRSLNTKDDAEVSAIQQYLTDKRIGRSVNCFGFALWYCGLQDGPADNLIDFYHLGCIRDLVDVVEKPGEKNGLPTIVAFLNRIGEVDHMGVISPFNPTKLIQRQQNGSRESVPIKTVSLEDQIDRYNRGTMGLGAVVFLQPKREKIIAQRHFSIRRPF